MKNWMVRAYPSKRSIQYGATWRHEAGPFDEHVARAEAREQRARKVYGKVEVIQEGGAA